MSPVIAGGATLFAVHGGHACEVMRAGRKARMTQEHYVCSASEAAKHTVVVASTWRFW